MYLRLSFTFFSRFYPVWQDRGSFASPESLHIWPCPGTLNRLHSSIPASPPPFTSLSPQLSSRGGPGSIHPPPGLFFHFPFNCESEQTKERIWENPPNRCWLEMEFLDINLICSILFTVPSTGGF